MTTAGFLTNEASGEIYSAILRIAGRDFIEAEASVGMPEHDPHVNPLGVKGVGEIAMVGVAPAIANATYNATGRRIRTLPVTPDKLL